MNYGGLVMLAGAAGFVSLLVIGGILMCSGTLASRGLQITGTRCESQAQERYIATVGLRNTEDRAKAVSIRVQGRFSPRAGQQWPDRQTRFEYSAVSQNIAAALGPQQSAEAQAEFVIPVEGLDCEARASINRQQRTEPQHD